MTVLGVFGGGISWGIFIAIVAIDIGDRIRTRRRERKART